MQVLGNILIAAGIRIILFRCVGCIVPARSPARTSFAGTRSCADVSVRRRDFVFAAGVVQVAASWRCR